MAVSGRGNVADADPLGVWIGPNRLTQRDRWNLRGKTARWQNVSYGFGKALIIGGSLLCPQSKEWGHRHLRETLADNTF